MKKINFIKSIFSIICSRAIAHEVVTVSCQCNDYDTLAFGYIIEGDGKTEKETIYKAKSECEKISYFDAMLQYCSYVINGNYINTYIDLCEYDFQGCGTGLIDG